jgi:hypothetical protein
MDGALALERGRADSKKPSRILFLGIHEVALLSHHRFISFCVQKNVIGGFYIRSFK